MWLNIFKKKKYEWINIYVKEHIDFSNMPGLSPNSPIKNTSIPHLYRYCPLNNKLMKRRITKPEWYDVDLKSEIIKHEKLKLNIEKIIFVRKRDHVIDNILNT